MSDDPFAFQVQRLTDRHRSRHAPATVAEVTLQRWLVLSRRYNDPFDPAVFDHIDAVLARMPASVETTGARPSPRRRGGTVHRRVGASRQPVGRRS